MKKEYFYLGGLLIGLLIIAVFSKLTGIHDTGEYVTIAKSLAGIQNVKLFSAHSTLYPFILSFFLKIWPSLTMIRITSALTLFFIGLVLYKRFGFKAFLIYLLSPLLWYDSISVSPILLVSLFFLLSYEYITKWREDGLLKDLGLSAFFMGLCLALWSASVFLFIAVFVLYLFDQKIKTGAFYLIFVLVGFFPRLIADHIVTGFFLHSTLRYIGANIVIPLGLAANKLNPLSLELFFKIIFWISPLFLVLFLRFKKRYYREISLIGLFCLFFYFRTGEPRIGFKYFIVILPVICVLLAKQIDLKWIKKSAIVSLLFILLIIPNYLIFTPDRKYEYGDELAKIREEFGYDRIVAGPNEALLFAMFLWEEKPEIIWYEDYFGSNDVYSSYSFITPETKNNIRKRMQIEASLVRSSGQKYADLPIVSHKLNKMEGYNLIKCYDHLCVYSAL